MRIIMYGQTHIGKVRRVNQDAFVIRELGGIAVVADGIGGRNGGEVASQLAVDSICQSFDQSVAIRHSEISNFLVGCCDAANASIRRHAANDPSINGMGTTINALVFVGESLYIAHIGDSRTYLHSPDGFWQLTIDHSIENYVERGWLPAAALVGNKPQALVRALGLADHCEADIYERPMRVGEVYLSCSDGLSGMVSDRQIAALISDYRTNLPTAVDKLVEAAMDGGGKDNITVVLCEVAA